MAVFVFILLLKEDLCNNLQLQKRLIRLVSNQLFFFGFCGRAALKKYFGEG